MSESLDNHLLGPDDFLKLRDMFWGLSTLLYDLGLETPHPRTITRIVLDLMLHTKRKYHTPVHVIGMFEWAEKHGIKLSKAQQLAIWFHDSIYVAVREDSEERSSLFMKALVGGLVSPEILSEAHRIIISTRYHLVDGMLVIEGKRISDSEKLVMDLDLSHFAREEEVCLYADQLVKEEFVPLVREEDYEKGRIDFFKALLARKSIYKTDLFKEQFEDKARENIEKLINT